MKPERQADWDRLKELALGLGLPRVEETTSWGQPTLKAHGKLWVWWSPHEDAPVFKVPFEEREILLEAEPNTYFITQHYKSYPLVLARPENLDLNWAKANLIRVWRAQAPKRMLKAMTRLRSVGPQVEAAGEWTASGRTRKYRSREVEVHLCARNAKALRCGLRGIWCHHSLSERLHA